MITITQQQTSAFALTCPLLLNDEAKNNPYLFLKEFLEFASLEEYKKDLSEWYRTAVSIEVIFSNANNLLFLHSQIIQLLHAGILIATTHQETTEINKSLTYISETLNLKSIKDIRYGLNEWLFSALSMDGDLSSIEHKYSFALYEMLLKIIEELYNLMILRDY